MESSNEKNNMNVSSEKGVIAVDDYTLVELSLEETLVEFSSDSTADPSKWIFVSYILLTDGFTYLHNFC
jgi:hypothetical protein